MLSFFKDYYQHLLAPNEAINDSKEYRRLILVRFILGVTAGLLLLFSFIHAFVLVESNKVVPLIDFLGALATIIALINLKTTQKIDQAALIGTTSLLLFFVSFVYLSKNESFGLIWTIFFPIIALTINSTRRGLIFSLLFLLATSIISFQGIGEWQNGLWDLKSFLRLNVALSMIILIMYIHEVAMDKAQKYEQDSLSVLEELSLNDALTGIANRRRINSLLDTEFERAKRYQTPFSIVLFDIDYFKKINDNYGHLVGDNTLKSLSKLVNETIRKTEVVGRWGGEEFILILPEANINTSFLVAEKIRKIISKTKFKDLGGSLTCSFGVSEYKQGITLDELIEQADQALYKAKENGRNMVTVYGHEEYKTE